MKESIAMKISCIEHFVMGAKQMDINEKLFFHNHTKR